MSIPVTVILPVKNEEQNLRNCLPLLKVFDQRVVVDSQSTDGTTKVAMDHRVEVYQFHWDGKYPKKRNWSLENLPIKNDWVLFLDADEHITEDFILELRDTLTDSSADGYWLTYRTYFMGKALRYGDKLQKLALFRRKKGRFEPIPEENWSQLDMEVHEQAKVEGRVGKIKASIKHRDYKGLKKYIEKHNEYSSWEAYRFLNMSDEELKGLSRRKRMKYGLMKTGLLPLMFFFGCYFLKLGFLDGKEGFYYAIYKSYYFFQIQTKIKEMENNNTSN